MAEREIPAYNDYVSPALFEYLRKEARPVAGVPGLLEVGRGGGLESTEALKFVCDLYRALRGPLNKVLQQRVTDRAFLDARVRSCYELNRKLGVNLLDPRYETPIGHEDGNGRIVFGPKNDFYCRSGGGKPIAELPEELRGIHVTLFGPPDDAKLSINAMNAYHRKLKGEPAIVEKLLATQKDAPKWGADDEDSKTPLRSDLVAAGEHLTECFEGTLHFADPKNGKTYSLEKEKLALPIKRFPGLALPCSFLFLDEQPLPLHIYDFALHLYRNWKIKKALSFYVPKLENEDEAAYVHLMMETAEKMIKAIHPEYAMGSIRLFIVLENPRAIFRVNEIMDALHPYFAGASLGWHDYLSSTARLFKEDANYRIPVKADPDIVIKYIKASHDLLADVVGARGGIKIGGMYGVLPMDTDLFGDSFQITMKGYIKDVITQMKRDLSGFWVAHPDFVRIGLAMVEAWRQFKAGDRKPLDELVTSLLVPKYHDEILGFIHGSDIRGLDKGNPLYPRSLVVADIGESNFIANNHPDEIRYNVFQSLQYLTDWLSGNGCVALPAQIEGTPVRVMDDLATAERSRWEVWHELRHGRFPLDEFLRIAHEELVFIRKDLSDKKKIVQVKWDERTEKWYPVAFRLMVQLMTAETPPEFASELLIPFTVESIRQNPDPWNAMKSIDPLKYAVDPWIERFNDAFSACGSVPFAKAMAAGLTPDFALGESIVKGFGLSEVVRAASFHGDIGESKKTLDHTAAKEQGLILGEDEKTKAGLRGLGADYLKKFGVKFLISAQGKTGGEILAALKERLNGTPAQELDNARHALWEITRKRLRDSQPETLSEKIDGLCAKNGVVGAQIAIAAGPGLLQTLNIGQAVKGGAAVSSETEFEIASLSKTLASAFALEYFRSKKIPLETTVNSQLAKSGSSFRIPSLDPAHPEWGDQVTLRQLMNHAALNMHYVNGVPLSRPIPNVRELLEGNAMYGYDRVGVPNEPGTVFQYSGGGFLVLEHLLETMEKKSVHDLTEPFFRSLGLSHLSFQQKDRPGVPVARAYLSDGREVEDSRKMFPAFAAGAMGTATDVTRFLARLTGAFRSLDGDKPISHETAVEMLHGTDIGSRRFMGAKMGLGVFVAEAGPNRLALHQGANDGYRCLFVHCFEGPDRGKGFTILCNGDLNGVLFVAEAAQLILRELGLRGLDPAKFKTGFDATKMKPEEIVNLAYKDLVFAAFESDLPEAIVTKGPLDPLSKYNLAANARVLEATNQGFARAENLVSPFKPVFDPELYGRQGKIMDSWETVRHNPKPFDEAIFDLAKAETPWFVSFSTQYHLGNHSPAASLDGQADGSTEWIPLIPRVALEGHSIKKIKLASSAAVKRLRVRQYPDGGLTRLAIYGDGFPADEQASFAPLAAAKSVPCDDKIPHSKKPLTPKFDPSRKVALPAGGDLASSAFGGRVVSASNEHYGPAAQIISPYPPLNMFDGFESARSRGVDHYEEVVLELAQESSIRKIEIDFTFFRNNNPLALSIDALNGEKWIPLVEKTVVKSYAGNEIAFILAPNKPVRRLKITVYPDGGMNRVRVYG